MSIRKATPDATKHTARVRTPVVHSDVVQNARNPAPTVETGKPATTPAEGFVKAHDDVPVDTHVVDTPAVAGSVKGKNVQFDAKLGKLAGGDKKRSSPAAVELTPQQRLISLLGKGQPPEASKPPKPAVLQKAVENALGFHEMRALSALEVAKVLGAPSWADAIRDAGLCSTDNNHQPNWLLAVHLTKWMQSIAYPGATLSDVAESFKAAHPDQAQSLWTLKGDLVAALQRAYPFMPQWSSSPAPVAAAADDDWTSVAVKDPFADKLATALEKITEVPLAMRLTSDMGDKLAQKQPFKGANVVMVQHMLGQANPLVDSMVKAGMDVTRAEYVGIPYQQNPAVRTTLEQGHGVAVTVPELGNIDDMWKVITAAVDRAWERHQHNGEPILILDDGGYASKYIADKYKGHGDVFKVVEQTTRGLTEISKIENVEHSIVDVAGSYGKRFESAQVGDAVKMAVRRVLDAVTTTPTRKDVLIVGAGKVGEGVADSFHGDGARITIFDPFITPARKKELEAKGYTVVTDKAQALDKKFLVVGCSGHRSIDMSDFAKMSSPVFLASASSKRVEIDTIGLGELAKDKEGHLRKILAAKVNEQETWHYFLQDGRIVTAMADGLPVNFQAVNSIAPELIDHTMALMLLGAAQAMTATKPGLNMLDPETQFWLQAKMENIDPLGDGPVPEGKLRFSLGDMHFIGAPADWMRVAQSPATPPAVLRAMLEQIFANPKDAMDPLALAILGSKHDVDDKTIDMVLDMQIVPHVARLLQNEALTEAQEERLLGWLEQSFWAAAGYDRDIPDVSKANAVAVVGDAKTGYGYMWADVIDIGNGKTTLAHRVTTVADAVIDQTSDILFGHPRAPESLRAAFLQNTYAIAGDGRASTVLRVRSPAWSTEQLDKLFQDCLSAAYSRRSSSGNRESFEYAYDLMEAFRDHPSASAALSARADELMDELLVDAKKKGFTLQGHKGWTPSPLGIALPDYR